MFLNKHLEPFGINVGRSSRVIRAAKEKGLEPSAQPLARSKLLEDVHNAHVVPVTQMFFQRQMNARFAVGKNTNLFMGPSMMWTPLRVFLGNARRFSPLPPALLCCCWCHAYRLDVEPDLLLLRPL